MLLLKGDLRWFVNAAGGGFRCCSLEPIHHLFSLLQPFIMNKKTFFGSGFFLLCLFAAGLFLLALITTANGDDEPIVWFHPNTSCWYWKVPGFVIYGNHNISVNNKMVNREFTHRACVWDGGGKF